MGESITREECLRRAEQHDNAAYLAYSYYHYTKAGKLWARRDEYLSLAKTLPTPPAADAPERGE